MSIIRNSCLAVAALLIASSAFVFAQAPAPAPAKLPVRHRQRVHPAEHRQRAEARSSAVPAIPQPMVHARSPTAASPLRLGRQNRRRGRNGGQDHQRRQVRKGRRRLPRRHRPRHQLLEPDEQGLRRLHRESDFQRAQVHEPQHAPASLRRLHRRQRPRHADKENDLYCAAYGNGTFIVRGFGPDAVPDERPPRRAQ